MAELSSLQLSLHSRARVALSERFCAGIRLSGALYKAEVQPHQENDIKLQVTLNPYLPDEEIGRKLLKLFNSCVRWNPDASQERKSALTILLKT
jgi:hypothetical protein